MQMQTLVFVFRMTTLYCPLISHLSSLGKVTH